MPSYKSPSKKKTMLKKSTKKSPPKKIVNKSMNKGATKTGYKFHKRMGRYDFYAPSKSSGKKYDAFDAKTGKKLASFGNVNYEQYKDKIGYYRSKDHGSQTRRNSYIQRHRKDKLTDKYKKKESAGYFSMNYLW